MKLHILGSGTCIPNERRGSSGYALRLENSTILLDCGNGITWKLGKAGIDYLDIDLILITHFHPDHVSDLIPLLFGTKYNFEKPRSKPLHIVGPEGFRNFFSELNNTFNNWLNFDLLVIHEAKDYRSVFSDHELEWTTTPHTENSICYKITSGDKKLVYTGDTGYSEKVAEFSAVADLLITECSQPSGVSNDKHLGPEDVAMMVNLARPLKTVVSHLYPACDRVDLLDQIKEHTDCEIVIAEDMMEIEV